MTAYGTDARRAEIVNLQIADIDNSMMRIHIREGKGGKDREIPLSLTLYGELRQHYRRLEHKPKTFPGGLYHSSEEPISDKVVLVRLPYRRRTPVCARLFIPTPCATASPLTITTAEPTSAPFRDFSAITLEPDDAVCSSLQQAHESPGQSTRPVAAIRSLTQA